jgi:hypothetical protein
MGDGNELLADVRNCGCAGSLGFSNIYVCTNDRADDDAGCGYGIAAVQWHRLAGIVRVLC